MAQDLTALAVAVVGVAGTMAAPWLAQLARRSELRLEAERADRTRRQDRDAAEFERRRERYAALNEYARTFRTSTLDVAHALRRGESVPAATWEALAGAREAYRAEYAQAQMILPEATLDIVSEVSRCLSHGYQLVRSAAASADPRAASAQAVAWLENPLSDGVWLLRRALREDLGVTEATHDLPQRAAGLRSARRAQAATVPRLPQGRDAG
ncbi:hypothetical protein [Kitasatospora sp. NPDC059571]|uniref:hypothetical protein n=1 Tax=Kitasatospora sp. NPDC059571 TaxID=3346871 RepID=UPI00367A02AF